MLRYRIEATLNGVPMTPEETDDWAEVRFRVPFIRDVCGWDAKVFKRSGKEWKRHKAPHKQQGY